MKICYFINAYPKISHTFIRREIQALEDQGVEVLRVSLRRDSQNLIDPADKAEADVTHYILENGWVPLLACFLRQFANSPGRALRLLAFAFRIGLGSERGLARHFAYVLESAKLADLCREQGAQHIHSHFGTNSATVAMFATVLNGGEFSFTAHGADELDQARNRDMREKLMRAKFVIAVSWFVRSQLLRRIPLSEWPKIRVVHCGLGADYLNAPIADYPSAPVRFVCLGRLCEEKAQQLLIQAAARVRDHGHDFRLVLAGDGPLRDLVEKEIASNRLEGIVSITGWIDGARVRAELEQCHIMILPSLIEGLPVAIMEAMALGRPVLSTFVSGIPELVEDGETGWLVPAGDIDGLANAMITALKTGETELARMGQQAKSRVQDRHDARKEAAKLVTLFTD